MSGVLQAAVLGIVEGLTEFLPVSSTGHLILAGHLLGYRGEQAAAFEIFIQLGAILAVVWLYRVPLGAAATGLVRRQPESWRLVVNLFLAFVPSAGVGLMLHRTIKEHLFSPTTVGITLVAGGIAIWIVEATRPTPRVSRMDGISATVALGIGLAQCLSLVPGVSRSAATILGGMVLGLDRKTATVFSFYLAIPTMLAASGFELLSVWSDLTATEVGTFVVGFVVAFVAAVAAVRFLLHYIAAHDFKPFAYYRVLFGLVVLFAFPAPGA